MSEIIIYKGKDGQIELNVNLSEETVWLSQKHLSDLFDKNVRTISEHISNIFKEGELQESAVVRNFRTTATDGKTYDTKHYNLDVIISVGYRVNSKQGTAFRQWAAQVLKDHLIRGYTTYEKRLTERGLKELQQTITLLHKTLVHHDLVDEIGDQTIQLIMSYAKTWHLLLAYDEDKLSLPEKGEKEFIPLEYQAAKQAIASLKRIYQHVMKLHHYLVTNESMLLKVFLEILNKLLEEKYFIKLRKNALRICFILLLRIIHLQMAINALRA